MMIKSFLDYLQNEKNYSPRTLQSYDEDLTAFESYFKNLDNHLSWESVDSDIIRDWMESMMDKGNAATSINRRLSSLRSFYRYTLSHSLTTSDPAHKITGPKKHKPLPVFMKEKEMDELLDERMWTSSYEDMCARTILMTFYETGIRLSELIGLDDKDVDFVQRELKVTGKRNKQRIIPFGDELCSTLGNYIKLRDDSAEKKSPALFVTGNGERMKANHVRNVVRKNLSRVCTLKKRTPHVLRHTFATAMLNHQAGLESVKQLLGHQSLETTEIYTHTKFEQLKKVYISAHPRA